jgi:hypothetical protein
MELILELIFMFIEEIVTILLKIKNKMIRTILLSILMIGVLLLILFMFSVIVTSFFSSFAWYLKLLTIALGIFSILILGKSLINIFLGFKVS